jgi:uncharacterized membrane protein YphA (DoxX/SURF4 family)
VQRPCGTATDSDPAIWWSNIAQLHQGGDHVDTRRRQRPIAGTYLGCADGVAAQRRDFLLLVSRVLFGWIFISSRWRKLMDIPAFVATMPRRDLPMARLCHPPVEFIGGVFSVIGFVTRSTAMIMLLFIIIATFSSHRYLEFSRVAAGQPEQPLLDGRIDDGWCGSTVHQPRRPPVGRSNTEQKLISAKKCAGLT